MSNKPTEGMVSEAERGLAWRSEYGRGGTEVGIARARDISNGKNLSDDTVKRMYSFFSRHEVDKKAEGFRQGEEGYPSNGRIAWALWGGDAGFSWSKRLAEKLSDERSMQTGAKSGIVEAESEVVDMTEEVELEQVEAASDDQVERAEAVEYISDDEYHADTPEEAEAEPEAASAERFSRDNMETRSMDGGADVVDVDARRVKIAVSSEEPVERSFGNEILDHTERSIDLEFLNSGRAPLLLDHDPRQQIGVVESVTLDASARRLRATVRFGKNGLAKDVFDDVADGIRGNISVGYQVNKLEQDGKDSYRAVNWTPMEVSVVSIPADRTVGVGRSAEDDLEHRKPEETPQKEATMSELDIEAVKAEAVRAAAKDHAEIYALGGKHQQREMAEKAVAEGRSLTEFRGELLNVIGNKPLADNSIGLEPKEVRKFSLLKAVRAHANPTDRAAQHAAAFELEASAAASEAYGREAQGIMIPDEVLRSWSVRDLNTSDDSAVIADDFRGGSFIDVLRNQSSVMQAGATMLTGLQGNVKIPKKTAASSAAWISTEGGASAESEPTLGQVTMAPKTLGAHTDITRLMMMQSSLDIEALVRNDLTAAIALAIDLGALAGSGTSGQPTGIKNTSGINAPTSFAAANPTFAEVVAMETAVAEDNALTGNLAYILPAGMYGALKTTAKDSGSGQFVVGPDGQMNGYNTIVSNQATAGDLYFGNFSDLLIGMYGGLDIVVDPYTSSTSGTVRIVALQTCDVAVRHAVSFAFNNDGA